MVLTVVVGRARPEVRRLSAYTAAEGLDGTLEGTRLTRPGSGGERASMCSRANGGQKASGRSERQQSVPIAARYDCRPWEEGSCLVLERADGERQLVADVGACDKTMGNGDTADAADAGTTTNSILPSGSAAHRLCVV